MTDSDYIELFKKYDRKYNDSRLIVAILVIAIAILMFTTGLCVITNAERNERITELSVEVEQLKNLPTYRDGYKDGYQDCKKELILYEDNN